MSKVLNKISKTLHENMFSLHTDRTSEKGPWNLQKKIIREFSVKFDMFSKSPRDISRFSPRIRLVPSYEYNMYKKTSYIRWLCCWRRTERWRRSRHYRSHRQTHTQNTDHTSPRDRCRTQRFYVGRRCMSLPSPAAAPATSISPASLTSRDSLITVSQCRLSPQT